MTHDSSPDFPEFDKQTSEIWDRIAEWWDNKIGDGNSFQDILIEPATERLFSLQPGECVLDIACGAGRFARRMAALGATVVAIDHSEKFIERARKRTTESTGSIQYHVMDANDHSALISLGEAQFDAAVCTMGLMDMSSIEPLIATLPQLLKPRGRFVFSVLHPAFNSGTVRQVAEQFDHDGELITRFGVTVTDYTKPFVYKGLGIVGQPVPQHYFHRSISLLFTTCFRHGFVLDGIEEPAFPDDFQSRSNIRLSWERDLRSIPPVLVARMRLS